MKKKINYGRHYIDKLDANLVIKSLNENLITTGNYVNLFEKKIRDKFKLFSFFLSDTTTVFTTKGLRKLFDNLMRLTLGTANFLKNYSLIQKDNLNPLYKKKLILKAKILGIKFIDTSPSYGNAEKIIGKTGVKIFKIITKIPKLPKSKTNNISDWILKNLKNSLKNLNQKKIYALLIHDKSDFMNNKKNYLEAFNIIKRKDLVEKIGVSLYEAKDLNKIVKYWKPDIVQIPYNIIDRRIQNKKFINVIKKNSIELHVRSIFLKGMLVNQKVYPEAFNEWRKKINYWFKWCKNKKIKPSTAAFLFVKKNKLIKNIIVGFDKIDQMIEIKKFENSKIKKFPHIKIHDRLFLNPAKW